MNRFFVVKRTRFPNRHPAERKSITIEDESGLILYTVFKHSTWSCLDKMLKKLDGKSAVIPKTHSWYDFMSVLFEYLRFNAEI